MAMGGAMNPGGQASRTLALTMKLLGQHESAPKNFTAVDVTDPRNPKLVVQRDLPHGNVRSNSLDVVGDMMAVAYQVRAGTGNPNDPDNIRQNTGMKPAGIDLFDISTPEDPKVISH